jgi:hypothetical protein
MYTDFMLRFSTEAEANTVLYRQGNIQDLEQELAPVGSERPAPVIPEIVPKFRNIDTIGVIYQGGEWDADGNVLVEPIALPGWHVNVRALDGENTEGLEAFEVHPESPVRVWA